MRNPPTNLRSAARHTPRGRQGRQVDDFETASTSVTSPEGRRYTDRRPHIGPCQFSRGQPGLPALLRGDHEDDHCDDCRHEHDDQVDDDREAE
jgi:hypothetical protein